MSYLGGIIAGAIGGVGDAGQQITQQNAALMDKQDVMNQQLSNEQTLSQQRSDLEIQKAKAIAQANAEISSAPLNRLGASAKTLMQKDIPVEAHPVTSLTQDSATASGLQSGIQGSPEVVNGFAASAKKILQDPKASDEDKADAQGILDQISKQVQSQSDINAESVSGKTRNMTNDEALTAALSNAKVNDPAAYIAGKQLVEDKYINVADGGTLFDKTSGKVVFQNNNKDERARERDEAADERLDKRLRSQETIARERMEATLKGKEVNEADVEKNAQMIAKGRAPALSGFAMKNAQGAAIMARVFEINPDYSATDYRVKLKAAQDFGTGKQGNNARSFNVSISHLETLSQLADALENKDTQGLNKIANGFSAQFGSPAPTNFDAAKKVVADELVKAIVGSGGGVADREEAAKTLSKANSPAQLKGVISTYKDLMRGQLDGLRDQYKRTTGYDDFDEKFLSEAARSAAHGGIRPPTELGAKTPNAMVFSSKDELKSAISAGKIKAGDTFTDPNGVSHVVQ